MMDQSLSNGASTFQTKNSSVVYDRDTQQLIQQRSNPSDEKPQITNRNKGFSFVKAKNGTKEGESSSLNKHKADSLNRFSH